LEIKEVQLQIKGDVKSNEDQKKKKKKYELTGIENDGLVKFSKLLINTKKLSVVEKFVESLEDYIDFIKDKDIKNMS